MDDAQSTGSQSGITQLLAALRAGDPTSLDALFPLLYEELRRLAHAQRRRWRGNDTLNSTALLNEAYLKLMRQKRISVESRAHFLALASAAMRHILTNYAEERRAQKRGGGLEPVSLRRVDRRAPDISAGYDDSAELLAELDLALRKLERMHSRSGRVVECRFYGGLSVQETAAALDISTRTVKRDWAFAQTWLQRELREASGYG